MSFFDPNIIFDDGLSYKQHKYKQIIEEQVMISYLSQSLSFVDTDILCPYDRKLVLDTLKQIKDEEAEQLKKSMRNT